MTGGRILFTFWLALTLPFVVLRCLPSDGIEARLSVNGASEAQIAAERARFGLDKPILIQYSQYVWGLPRGEWGISVVTHEPVLSMIRDRLPATLDLGLRALLVGIGVGFFLGSGALIHPFFEMVIYILLATPIYWLGTVAIYLASYPLREILGGELRAWLPSLVLGLGIAGGIGRVVMSALGDSFRQTYMQTARAKGLGWWGIYRHAVRANLPPIISVVGLQAGFLLSGTVIIEMMFTRRGLGSLLHQAVLSQDYPVVQGVILISAGIYFLTQVLADFLRRLADPRVG